MGQTYQWVGWKSCREQALCDLCAVKVELIDVEVVAFQLAISIQFEIDIYPDYSSIKLLPVVYCTTLFLQLFCCCISLTTRSLPGQLVID